MDDQEQLADQIEFRWQRDDDLSPVAHSLPADQLRMWSARLSGLVRPATPDAAWGVPAHSVAYQLFDDGYAALIWRRYDEEAIALQDNAARRPLVARALIGRRNMLKPALALALSRAEAADTHLGPPPGQVRTGTVLPQVGIAQLNAVALPVPGELDDTGGHERGVDRLIAAALRDPGTPLSVLLPGPEMTRGLWDCPQLPMLWMLLRTTFALMAMPGDRHGWSFSSYEPPPGSTDTRGLASIVFRSQELNADRMAPPTLRPEITVRPRSTPGRSDRFDELAGLLLRSYRELGSDELRQRLAEIAGRYPDVAGRLDAAWLELSSPRRGPSRPDGQPAVQVQPQPAAAPPPTAALAAAATLAAAPGPAPEPPGAAPAPAPGPQHRDSRDKRWTLTALLDRIDQGPGHPDFETARDMLAQTTSPPIQERAKARNLMPGRNWYIPSFAQRDPFHVEDELAAVFAVTVLPDLQVPGVAAQLTRWAAESPPEVIRGLSAAACRVGGQAPQLLSEALQPALHRRWLAEHSIYLDAGIAGLVPAHRPRRAHRPRWQLIPAAPWAGAAASALIWLCLALIGTLLALLLL